MKKLKATKGVMTTCLSLVVAAGVAFGATSLTGGQNPSQKFSLQSSTQFSITGIVTATATGQSPALLYQGAKRFFRCQVTNPFSIPITVTSMDIASVRAPQSCPVTNLDDSGTSFTGSLLVDPGPTSVVAEPISLFGGAGNQDACEAGTFAFTFAGTATYTDSTATVLSSSSNPSTAGGDTNYRPMTTRTDTLS